MTQRTLRTLQQGTDSVTFADSNNVNATTRVRVARAQKTVESQRLTNVRTEVIVNQPNAVVIGDDTVTEQLSLRLTVSGSTLSEAQLVQMWKDLKVNFESIIAAKTLSGFVPFDVPLVIDSIEG